MYLSGIWKTKRISCHSGDLSRVFCLGSSHITNVDSKLLHYAKTSLRIGSGTKLQLVSMLFGWSCKSASLPGLTNPLLWSVCVYILHRLRHLQSFVAINKLTERKHVVSLPQYGIWDRESNDRQGSTFAVVWSSVTTKILQGWPKQYENISTGWVEFDSMYQKRKKKTFVKCPYEFPAFWSLVFRLELEKTER